MTLVLEDVSNIGSVLGHKGGLNVHVLRRALGALGIKPTQEENNSKLDYYQEMMRQALSRIRMAELQIQEATSLEELDIGRSAMQAGWAEVQQLVRTAKRDRGLTVRPIAETEELHRNMRDYLNHRIEGDRSPARRRTASR
jgi:polyribonucleotide nucleotidyltransferase